MKQPGAALAERRAAAHRLVQEKAYLRTADAVYVYSDRPGVSGYEVIGGRCPCPDAVAGYAYRELGGRCKHVHVSEIVQGVRCPNCRWIERPGQGFVLTLCDECAQRALAKPATPRRLPPTEEDAWLDAQDAKATAARRLEVIARQFGT